MSNLWSEVGVEDLNVLALSQIKTRVEADQRQLSVGFDSKQSIDKALEVFDMQAPTQVESYTFIDHSLRIEAHSDERKRTPDENPRLGPLQARLKNTTKKQLNENQKLASALWCCKTRIWIIIGRNDKMEPPGNKEEMYREDASAQMRDSEAFEKKEKRKPRTTRKKSQATAGSDSRGNAGATVIPSSRADYLDRKKRKQSNREPSSPKPATGAAELIRNKRKALTRDSAAAAQRQNHEPGAVAMETSTIQQIVDHDDPETGGRRRSEEETTTAEDHHDHLISAVLVRQQEDNANTNNPKIPVAQVVSTEQSRRNRRITICLLVFLVGAIGVAVGVGLSVANKDSSGGDEDSSVPPLENVPATDPSLEDAPATEPNESETEEVISGFLLSDFTAQYFRKGEQELVHSEVVRLPSINYAYSDFHGIDSRDFVGVWKGTLEVWGATQFLDIECLISRGSAKLVIDDTEQSLAQNDTLLYEFTPGTHDIEMTYTNNWHTVTFHSFCGKRQRATLAEASELIADNELIDEQTFVVHVDVYESSSLYSDVVVLLEKLETGQYDSFFLILESHSSVRWIVENVSGSKINGIVFGSYEIASSVDSSTTDNSVFRGAISDGISSGDDSAEQIQVLLGSEAVDKKLEEYGASSFRVNDAS